MPHSHGRGPCVAAPSGRDLHAANDDRRPLGVSARPGLGHLAACDDLADSVFRLCNPALYGRVRREGQGEGAAL